MEENKDYMTTDQILETAGIPLLLFVILIYYGMRLWFMKDISAIRGKNKPPVKDEENYAKCAGKPLPDKPYLWDANSVSIILEHLCGSGRDHYLYGDPWNFMA